MKNITKPSAFSFKMVITKKNLLWVIRCIFTTVAFFAPIAIFYITESMTHEINKYMNDNAQTLNMILYELIFFLLFGLFGSLRVSLIIETIFFTIFGLANYYVISFRSTPIQPWDFLSLKTAGSVASNFTYTLPTPIIWKILALIAMIVVFTRLKLKLPVKKYCSMRAGITSIAVLMLTNFTMNIHDESYIAKMHLYDKLFTPTTIFYRDGGAVAFLMELKYMSVEVPAHYSEKGAKNLLESQTEPVQNPIGTTDSSKEQTYPNVIVIMDEAFSDLSVLGDFTTNEDYMPFIHSLQNSDEATTGFVNVSVVGGNTANSEFEFLTGNTMAFLPAGSVAYQQYISDTIDSLPYYMNQLGYRTIAMHPFRATGWSRDVVYDYMTFDETYFSDSFSGYHKIRSYYSDEACVEKIIESYENIQDEDPDEPMFMFLVTMQNHSSYTTEYENFTPNITVEGNDSFALSSYLSLMQHSDKALEKLIDYFSSIEEDTIIVFYGDHQPADSVANNIYQLNGINKANLTDEELGLRYKVPFVIWTNFETNVEHDVETSANFLGLKMLQKAGIPLPNYWQFLSTVEEKLPVLSAQTVMDADGNYTSLKEQENLLHDYKVLQYYQLFDAKNPKPQK